MPGGRHRRRRRHGRSGAGFLEPALLLLLHRGPAHGYELIERLAEFGRLDVHPSVIYRVLRDMDARGWITSAWETQETQGPPRRVYQLTVLGDEVLGAYVQELEETYRRIGDLITAYRRHMDQGKGEYHSPAPER